MVARLRVLPPVRPGRHLALVDNTNCGEPIVAEAKRQQVSALQVAEELGVDLTEPKPRRTRRPRASDRNGPVVVKKFAWNDVDKATQKEALLLAGGDIHRCKPINANTVVVTNHPER